MIKPHDSHAWNSRELATTLTLSENLAESSTIKNRTSPGNFSENLNNRQLAEAEVQSTLFSSNSLGDLKNVRVIEVFAGISRGSN